MFLFCETALFLSCIQKKRKRKGRTEENKTKTREGKKATRKITSEIVSRPPPFLFFHFLFFGCYHQLVHASRRYQQKRQKSNITYKNIVKQSCQPILSLHSLIDSIHLTHLPLPQRTFPSAPCASSTMGMRQRSVLRYDRAQ